MNTRSALAAIAGFAVMSAGITPAESYFRSDFQISATQASVASGSSESTTSSSSTASSRSSKGSSAAKSSRSSSAKTIPFDSLPEKTQCMIMAVRKRESAIADSLENYYSIMSKMLEIRKGLIVKYWAELGGTKRDAEIRTTWRTFGSAWRSKGQLMREQRRSAWETFRTERTACGVYAGNDPEAAGLTADSQF